MSEKDLELRLRAWYGSNVPGAETAPLALRSVVAAIPRTTALPRRGLARPRLFAMLGAVGLIALAVVGALLVGGFTLPTVNPSPTSAPATARPSAAQADIPTPRPTAPIAGMVSDWRQVFAASDSVAWVVSPSAAYRTEDLGTTWRDVTPPSGSVDIRPFIVMDADTAYSAPSGTSSVVYATRDGGATWSPSIVDSVALDGPPALSFSTPTTGTATFFAPGSTSLADPESLVVYGTTDGGTHWVRTGTGALPQLKDGTPNKLQGPVAGYLFRSAGLTEGQPFNNRFFLSGDGGVTWQQDAFPISERSPQNAMKAIEDIVRLPDGHLRIAFSSDGSNNNLAVYESTDDPSSWRLIYQVPDSGFTIQLLTPTTWMLVSQTEVRSTVDAGATWASVTPAHDGFWHVHFATSRTGWARVGGTGDPNTLIVTTDGGATWRRVGT